MRGLRALLFCITLQRNKSPINWTICFGNLLFNVKTADNRLIGGVIEAPKGIPPSALTLFCTFYYPFTIIFPQSGDNK